MWIQATVLILLAGIGYVMVAAYSRGYLQGAAAVEDPGPDGRPVPNGPPGAPTRADLARLHDALSKKFGVNARGLPRVAHVDYDGWPDRLLVVFALDHNPATMTPDQALELQPMLDVLRAVHAGGLQWRWVMLSGTAPVEGFDHKVTEATVLRAVFPRDKLDRADWSQVKSSSLPILAQQFSVDGGLAERRLAGAPPALLPVTRPTATPQASVDMSGEEDQSSKKSR